MQQAITCLIFDLGGVLVRNVWLDRLQALLPAPAGEEELKARLLASPSFRSFELGQCDPPDFARAFVEELHLRCSPEAFIEDFRSWPQGPYPGVATWLEELRDRYKVACLSNSNVLHWQQFEGFLQYFDVPMSSHLLGVIKPDANCFERALDECAVSAGEAFFLDDARVNVEAARALGIRASQVSGFAAAQAAVRQLEYEGRGH